MKKQKNSSSITGVLASAALSRAVINTSNRFIYPFAGVISRGLGVPLTAVTSVIALNQATALLGLFTSHIGDKNGYKKMMLNGLLLLSSGMLLAGAVPVYYSLFTAMFLAGFAKNLFDPAIQAYVGKRVPFHRRGLAVGILEISWAAATLIGIPACGLLIDRFGWRSPFFALAALAMFCGVMVFLFIMDDSNENRNDHNGFKLIHSLRELLRSRRAMGMAVASFFASFANDNMFVIYGPWLEHSFHLSVVALGMGTAVIGVAELCGSSSIAVFADRMGLKNAMMAGYLASSMSYLLIPVVGGSLYGALAGLFVVFLCFEFSVVAMISICTEITSGSRATMMSLFFASAGLGRVAGATSGVLIWQQMGMGGICLISALLNLLVVISLWWGLGSWKPEEK